MATMYAWSPIVIEDKVTKGKFMRIPVGSEVTKQQVGDEFDTLVASGVLRPQKYPKGVRTGESPRNAVLRQRNEKIKELQGDPFKVDLEELEEDD